MPTDHWSQKWLSGQMWLKLVIFLAEYGGCLKNCYLSSTVVEQVVVMSANIILLRSVLRLMVDGLMLLTATSAFLRDFRDLSSLSMMECPWVCMSSLFPMIYLSVRG